MFHLVARVEGRALAFHTSSEAHALWDRLVRGVPGIVALCLMPDHVHLLATGDVRRSFGGALSGYARWRAARTGRSGPLFGRSPLPSPIEGNEKITRSERYVHLNPCRARLAPDPLAWPFSTHRDAVGLALAPVRRAAPDPVRAHAYTSADPTVSVHGTSLPSPLGIAPDLDQVFEAVAGLARVTPDGLLARGPARALFIRAARVLTPASVPEIAEYTRISARRVHAVRPLHDAQTRLVERVAGDDRFAALWPGDLRDHPRWGRYRGWA